MIAIDQGGGKRRAPIIFFGSRRCDRNRRSEVTLMAQ
jgi:hypothetical protein